MIPVPGLDQVRIAWIQIQAYGFILYGFMLYSDMDTPLVQYMQSGILELDSLSGAECAIFVIESPSTKWIEITRSKNHPWWKLFGNKVQEDTSNIQSQPQLAGAGSALLQSLVKNQQAIIVRVGEGQLVTLEHLLEPKYHLLYDRNEVWAVAKHFGIKPEHVPCLVFFNDLDTGEITIVDLTDLRSERQATRFFRRFFSSKQFNGLLKEARTHA
ncbi:MAG TPA: hypothetical protein VJ842_15025 [Pyrinomonadaceae bacterium]|nr:hypothetical protein [Pyrinomonadaceae bacterium]